MHAQALGAHLPGAESIHGSKKRLDQSFHCKFLYRDVQVQECLDDYVNANALNIKNSPCFKCAHGLRLRAQFSSI